MNEIDARIARLTAAKRALLEKLIAEETRRQPLPDDGRVAIIGMGCVFPGGVESTSDFWELLKTGKDAVTEVPRSRWDLDSFYDRNRDTPGKTYTRHMALVSHAGEFDAPLFGISSPEAHGMDPQHQLMLETVWQALEDAGYAPDSLSGSRTGVFMGIFQPGYPLLRAEQEAPEAIDPFMLPGLIPSIGVGRICHILGLCGPTMPVDSVCSSSLVALHLACQSLRRGESDMALVGGVNLELSARLTIGVSKMGAVSPTGRCHTFDSAADGFVQGEGCGVLILKRLSDAVSDHDNVRAVVRGTAMNHDGRSTALTAPHGPAQEAVIRAAIDDANVKPKDVSYVEAHGTGTPIGDPIEVRALGAVYGKDRAGDQRLLIGSVKTNIGHTAAAAGAAALIKIALAFEHELIPQHLNLRQLNPYISLDEASVAIAGSAIPWPRTNSPRLAGVSAFGMAGTNAHAIVEEPPMPLPGKTGPQRSAHVFTVGAKSSQALRELAGRYLAHLCEGPAADFGDVCFTANAGRARHPHRWATVSPDVDDLKGKLRSLQCGETARGCISGILGHRQAAPPVAFLFTGQGAQYPGMGQGLYETQSTFRETLDRCSEVLSGLLDLPLLDVMFDTSRRDSPLHQTEYTQVALFALEYSLAVMWRSWGVEPSFVAGHSVGECVAACVAGVIDLEAALKMVAVRGRLMQSLPAAGRMVVVMASEERVAAAVSSRSSEVSIAAINGPRNVVISGATVAIDEIVDELTAEGIGTQPLRVSHAFHSPLMQPICKEFESVVDSFSLRTPRIPIVSNLTGLRVEMRSLPDRRSARRPGSEDRRKQRASDLIDMRSSSYWSSHIRNTVRFADSIDTLRDAGVSIFVEMGPHPALIAMGAKCRPEDDCLWLASLARGATDWTHINESVAELFVRGVDINLEQYDDGFGRRRTCLPTYPMQRKPYWFYQADTFVPSAAPASQESKDTRTAVGGDQPLARAVGTDAPLLARCYDTPMPTFDLDLQAASAYLSDHRVHGASVVPAAAFCEAASEALDVAKETLQTLANVAFVNPLVLPDDNCAIRAQIVMGPERGGLRWFRVYSQSAGPRSPWTTHVRGDIVSAPVVSQDTPHLFELRSACRREIDVGALYQNLQQSGLQYGDHFRSILRMHAGDRQVLAHVSVCAGLRSEAASHQVHPALLDGFLQTAAACLLQEHGTGSTYVPVKLEQLVLHSRGLVEAWVHARLRDAASSPDSVVADLTILSKDGVAVGELRGLWAKRVERSSIHGTHEATASAAAGLYRVEWRRAELAPPATVQTGHWLILADRSGVGVKVSELLASSGHSCDLVYAHSSQPTPPGIRTLDPREPNSFAGLIEEVIGDRRPVRGVVHLWSLDAPANAELTQEALEATSDLCWLSLAYITRAMSQSSRATGAKLWVATRGAQSVSAEEGSPALAQAPAWGIARVLRLENPELWGGIVDLSPQGSGEDGHALCQLLLAEDQEDQQALRGDRRHVARLTRFRLEEATDRPAAAVRADATYLVTGGLGGLGLATASWLVDRGARSVLLWSRRRPSEGQEATLQSLKNAGAQITHRCVDVGDRRSVTEGIRHAIAELPPLKGIFHSAGCLRDAPAVHQDRNSFDAVLRPKVTGAWLLQELTQELKLDFLVLFSSASSVVGMHGQSNYAAANAFLDMLAHVDGARGSRTLSVNWGAWSEVGMAAEQGSRLETALERWGMEMLSPAVGIDALEHLLGHAHRGSWLVFNADWARFGSSFPKGRSPFFSELVATSQQSMDPPSVAHSAAPSTPSAPAAVPEASSAAPDNAPAMLDFLRGKLVELLGIPAEPPLEPSVGLVDLGVDSLLAVDLRRILQRDLDLKLPPTIVLDCRTLGRLASFLIEQRSRSQSAE